MAASKQDIISWFKRGRQDGATHMLVVCDSFDWDDYPVFVPVGASVKNKVEEYRKKEMQRIMEVYNLRLDMDQQMQEHRAWHTEETT